MSEPSGPSGPSGPVRVEVIPGALSVDVHAHDIASQTGPVACWSYVTDGLAAQQQDEMVFTLRREPGEPDDGFPEDPLQLFATIYQLAAGGQRVGSGGATEFGEANFFGHHVLYAPARALAGIALPQPCLAVLMVTGDELRAVRTFGSARVLARLGQAAFFYPFPPWADRKRRGLSLDRTFEASLLSKLPRASSPYLYAGVRGNAIAISALRAEQPLWAGRLAQLPGEAPLALLTGIDPSANGCLTWVPGQKAPEAIIPPGSDGSRLCGCFVVLLPGQPGSGGRMLEDGFAVELTTEAWQALRAALMAGAELEIPATNGGVSLVLTWRDRDETPAVVGSGAGASAAAGVAASSVDPEATTAATGAGRVALGAVRLTTPEAEFAARASAEQLGEFCREIQRATERALAGHDGPLELRLEVMCRPRSHRVGVAHRGDIAEPALDALIDAIEQLPTVPVTGEIRFELELTLGVGPRAFPG